jgi:hypothetical protein
VWGCLLLASATGVSVATVYWYIIQADPLVRDYFVSPTKGFALIFVGTLFLVTCVGLLRNFLPWVGLLLIIPLTLVPPYLFVNGIKNWSILNVLSSLVLLVFLFAWWWILLLPEIGVLTYEQVGTGHGTMVIFLIIMLLPEGFVKTVFDELERDANAFTDAVEELDGAVQEIDHELLARHGFVLPYSRASSDTEQSHESTEVVYTLPRNPNAADSMSDYYRELETADRELSTTAGGTGNPTTLIKKLDDIFDIKYSSTPPRLKTERAVIDAMSDYYRELETFERQLASVSGETGEPTAVTEQLCSILERRYSYVSPRVKTEQPVVNAAHDILEAYEILVTKNDNDGISELATRLNAVHSDVDADEYGANSEALVAWLNDIQDWTVQRSRRADLEASLADLSERWSETAGALFDLEIDVINQLAGSDSGELPISQIESGLEVVEQVIVLAQMVETVQADHQIPVLDRLPQAVGRYLEEGEINDARLERVEATLNDIRVASEAHRRHPSYPFDRVIEHLCSELETGTLDHEIDDMIDLIVGATDVIDFLDNVDTSHPSVQPEEWRETVHSGLDNVSPEIVRPLMTLVNRIGDTLWERHHLYEFSWEEFEQLVATAFNSKGYETSVTRATSDEGIDVWARTERERIAIQVKQFDKSNRVGRPTLQKLASTIAKGDADQVIVLTSGGFAQTAREYAADFGENMRLIDGMEFVQMLTESDIPPPLSEAP